jgi:hypothetical protein
MKTTNKTIKRARLIIIAVLALGVLSIGVHSQPVTATPNAPIPVTSCGQILVNPIQYPPGENPVQYILTGNLNCSGNAVIIGGSKIHFNLNGYTISGDGTGVGITVFGGGGSGSPGVDNHIHGGTVTGFGTGIGLFSGSQLIDVNDMTVTGNGNGLVIDSAFCHIRGSIFNDNSDCGIRTEGMTLFGDTVGNRFTGNTALGNGILDLFDSLLCQNAWRGNTFETDNETGADFGPGAGCIQ